MQLHILPSLQLCLLAINNRVLLELLIQLTLLLLVLSEAFEILAAFSFPYFLEGGLALPIQEIGLVLFLFQVDLQVVLHCFVPGFPCF